MLGEPKPAPPGDVRTIAVAVVTAALTTLATGLITMALDDWKERRKPTTPGDPQ